MFHIPGLILTECCGQDGDFYSMGISACNESAIAPHVYQTWSKYTSNPHHDLIYMDMSERLLGFTDNTLYSVGANFSNGPCATLAAWQAAGQDKGSKVLEMPPVAQIVAMGKAILQRAA